MKSTLDQFVTVQEKKKDEDLANISNLDDSAAPVMKSRLLQQTQFVTFENVRIEFPVRPYGAQIQMMQKIIHALNNSENALLESPTGIILSFFFFINGYFPSQL
ncbi:MAG: hypothetical protein EXX96DRAFT_47950 [Benjaminiella poitrasii]|nr:MAG: hypothetical protein EXX96DRAFT_47950 [Benjaminiella poitrasii]